MAPWSRQRPRAAIAALVSAAAVAAFLPTAAVAAAPAVLGPADPRERVMPPVPAPMPDGVGEEASAPAMVHPVDGSVTYGALGAQFGDPRGGRLHEGQDVFAPTGTPLVSITNTVVLTTGSGDGRGNFVELYDPRGRRTFLYFHMNEPARVHPGDRVHPGRRVGSVGCTGSCWGDHLHLEIHAGRGPQGTAVDPRPLLERLPRA